MSERTERQSFGTAWMLVVGAFAALMAWLHVYFARRLVVATELPEPWSGVALGALCVLGASIFVHPLAERRFGPAVAGVLGWPAHVWLGSCFYLLLSLLASDVALALLGQSDVAAQRARALGVCALVVLLVLVGTRNALRVPDVVRVELSPAGWPRALDGYRIVQISDIHVGALIRGRWLSRVVERCNARQPDLLAITGDLVDGTTEHYGREVEPLSALRARDGVCFVTGNHDHFSRAAPWIAKLEALGIEVLSNRRRRIERDGAVFELAGVDDYSASRLDRGHGHDLESALRGWDGTSALVLLAHDPRSFAQAQARGVPLQLSGHTHGGQLWPFALFVRLQTRHVAGVFRAGRSLLYVSRGTGFWGPPMRVLARPEITELCLRATEAA